MKNETGFAVHSLSTDSGLSGHYGAAPQDRLGAIGGAA